MHVAGERSVPRGEVVTRPTVEDARGAGDRARGARPSAFIYDGACGETPAPDEKRNRRSYKPTPPAPLQPRWERGAAAARRRVRPKPPAGTSRTRRRGHGGT